MDKTTKSMAKPKCTEDEDLERLAAEELLKEAKQLAEFAEREGPSAWQTRRINKTNKVFLRKTLNNAISSNRHKDQSRRVRQRENDD